MKILFYSLVLRRILIQEYHSYFQTCMISLSTSLAGIPITSCIGNASGPRDASLEELCALGTSESATIMMKSCTILPREGNPEPRYASIPHGSINSSGLPNLGYQAYLSFIPELKKYRKPLIASISGFSADEYIIMVTAFQKSDIDMIEVNLSCPNIVGKPQVGYDFDQTKIILQAISHLGDKPVGLKLPPYFDLVHFEIMADIIKQFPVRFVTCINSLGNTLVINPDMQRPLIKPKNGLGGLGGSYIKPVALANVYNFRKLLPSSMDIVGVGGVLTGTDAFEFLLAGASMVQVGTLLQEENTPCFAHLNQELRDRLTQNGYASAREAIGKLKTFN